MGDLKSYSFWIGLRKSAIRLALVAIPVAINHYPQWANFTIGGLLLLGANFLKMKLASD